MYEYYFEGNRKCINDDIEVWKKSLLENLALVVSPKVKNLLVLGEIQESDSVAMAVVGSRSMTEYGKSVCEYFVKELAAAGVTIVSGLMYGVDICAHNVALQSGGRTIAVLGYGFDYLKNQRYARDLVEKILDQDFDKAFKTDESDILNLADILDSDFKNNKLNIDLANSGTRTKSKSNQTNNSSRGAIITEFSNDQPPTKYSFPKRNRIIAGLSKATLIIEASKNSGSLITADYAIDQGKDVFVVPGPIFSSQSEGKHELIKNGARLVDSPFEILDYLGINQDMGNQIFDIKSLINEISNSDLDQNAKAVLLFLAENSEYEFSLDDIVKETGVSNSGLLISILSDLEFEARVTKLLGGRWKFNLAK